MSDDVNLPNEPESMSSSNEPSDVQKSDDTVPRDQYLRLLADVQNMRRTMVDEVQRRSRSAVEDLLRDLLPLMGHWSTGLSHVPDTSAAWYTGLAQVDQQMRLMLEKMGVEPVAKVGEPYDPLVHEALISDGEGDSLRISSVLQQGYRFRGDLLYPARVTVSHGVTESETPAA